MNIKYIVRKRKKDKKGNVTVWWRLYNKYKTKLIFTGVVLPPKDVVKGRIENKTIVQLLDQKLDELREKANPIIIQQPDILPEELWRKIKNMKTPDDIDFFEFFHGVWLQRYGRNLSEIRRKEMKATVNTFARLMDIKQLTVKNINDRIRHILEHFAEKLIEKGYKTAKYDYVLNMKQLIKEMARYYNDPDEIVKTWQLDYVKAPEREEGGAKPLSVQQIKSIFAMRFDNEIRTRRRKLVLARNVFLLSFCLMGTNLVDLYDCKIVAEDRICYNRSKVKKARRDHAYIEVDVPAQLKEIFDLYRDPTRERAFIFYKCKKEKFMRDINRSLKFIGKKIGVDNLIYYAARKSMATIARNNVRIDYNTINDMLLHSKSNQKLNDIYMGPDEQFREINEANKKLMDFMWGDMQLPSLKEIIG